MTPFDFLNAINTTKEDLIVDDITEKQYNAFMVNRGLSYFPDTIILANEMNKLYHLDNKLQNSFYINIVRKRKRFSKWFKGDTSDSLNAVKEYYGYSTEKARQVLSILSSDQISEIKNKVSHGGK